MSSLFLTSLLAALVSVAFLTLVGLAVLRTRRRRREAWKALAARHAWSFTEVRGDLEVQGLHDGRQLSLLTERRGSGQHSHNIAVLRLDLGDVLGRSLMLEDEELGDAEHLAPEVTRHLQGLREHYPRFAIVAGMLEAELRGVPATLEALEAGVAPALELADALSTASTRLTGQTSGG